MARDLNKSHGRILEMHRKLILASASPRRRELLSLADIECEVVVSHCPEVLLPGESPEAYTIRNAQEKALMVCRNRPSDTRSGFVLGADTVVVAPDNSILEKPLDAQHAIAMLKSLSGHTHRVVSGFAIYDSSTCSVVVAKSVETRVTFRMLSDFEIQRYVETGEPFDKAGGYGIQGKAAGFVHAIDGSYTNVVGLPLSHVLEVLTPYLYKS